MVFSTGHAENDNNNKYSIFNISPEQMYDMPETLGLLIR